MNRRQCYVLYMQKNELSEGLYWQPVSSEQRIYAGHLATLKAVAGLHGSAF